MEKIILNILIFSAVLFVSCTKTKEENSKLTSQTEMKGKGNLSSAGVKEGETEFTVEYFQPRKIYKIEKMDLNNDGNKEIMVMSVIKDSSDIYNKYYNFDMLEVFVLDPDRKSFVKILSDTVDYSESYSFVDLGNDSMKQMLINTNLGGNDKIASRGMFVYGMTPDNKINLIKYFDTGDPKVEDIKKDGNKEIMVSDLFYGVLAQQDAIDFVKEIYKFENQDLILRNNEFGEFYDNKITELLGNYSGVKKKAEMGMQLSDMAYPLYMQAAEVIINYYAKGDMKNLRMFWDTEKVFLEKNLPQDEYLDLSNFILKALPLAANA